METIKLIGLVMTIIIGAAFIIVMFFALKNHYRWFEKKNEQEKKHWKERYYSPKK